MIKRLEEIEKTVKSMIAELKGGQIQMLNPVQKAVKDITTCKSTRDEVKSALEVLCGTPEVLSVKQTAFCLYFALLNKSELGEDIDCWLGIQIGKHKKSERDYFIQQVWNVIDNNYKSQGDFKERLKNYLNSKKVK